MGLEYRTTPADEFDQSEYETCIEFWFDNQYIMFINIPKNFNSAILYAYAEHFLTMFTNQTTDLETIADVITHFFKVNLFDRANLPYYNYIDYNYDILGEDILSDDPRL